MERIRFKLPSVSQHLGVQGPANTMLKALMTMAALAAVNPAFAQTMGGLTVEVIDEGAAPVEGALVTLASDKLIGGSQERSSDESGMVAFTQLPPGSYNLTATHPSRQDSSLSGVQVNIGGTSRVTMIMSEVEVVVAENIEKAVDVSKTSRGTVLTREFLQKVPSGRSYQNATRAAAGVGVGPLGGGGNPNIGGAASDENTIMLDGANVTDPVTGTFSMNFNFDALEQIEVLLGGYMPEYGVSLGGVISLVTQSGSNNLSFNSSVYYTNGNFRPRMDERIASDGVTLAPTGFETTFETINIASYVSGPVVRDKAFFILSYSMSRSLIASLGTPQRRDYEEHSVYAKLTVQPSTEHRFTLAAQMDPTTVDNVFSGQFIKAESQGRQAQGGVFVRGSWQWFLSPDANLETAASYQKSFIIGSSVPCTHDPSRDSRQCRPDETEGEIDWYTPGRIGIGGAYDSINNTTYDFDDRFRMELSSKLTLAGIEDPLGGTHDFKFGVSTEQLSTNRIVGYNGNLQYYDINDVAFDPSTFLNYYWIEASEPLNTRNTGSIYSFFLQDSWKPVKNLTINYGTRYDNSTMRNDKGEATIQGSLWGPRLFAAWDPFGDQKTKIASGYGRFNDRGNLAISGFTNEDGFGSKLFLGEYFNGQFLNTFAENYSYSPSKNLSIAHDELQNPRTDEILLTVEREVIKDVALFSTMSGKFSRNIFEPDDRNFIYSENGDSIIGTRFGDVNNSRLRLRTPTTARRDVLQWDLGGRKVLSRRWWMQSTYTFMQSYGSTGGTLSGAFAVDPQTQYNYGRLLTDQNHVFRLQGFWDLPTDPWTQELGFFFVAASGLPLDRFYYGPAQGGYGVRLRPRGTYTRTSAFWDLSVKFSQAIDVRRGQLKVSVEAQNITNNRGGGFISTFQLASNNRYVQTSRQEPFRLQFGVQYQY